MIFNNGAISAKSEWVKIEIPSTNEWFEIKLVRPTYLQRLESHAYAVSIEKAHNAGLVDQVAAAQLASDLHKMRSVITDWREVTTAEGEPIAYSLVALNALIGSKGCDQEVLAAVYAAFRYVDSGAHEKN